MSHESQSYNMAAVRDLLLEAFTAEDLRRLFLYTENRALRPLLAEFSPGDGLAAMVDKTITFCRTRALLPDLLGEVQQARPRLYARFADRLSAAPAAAPPSAAPPTPAGGTTYRVYIERGEGIAIGDGAQVITSQREQEE